MLATVDLPILASVQRPWVGTQPVRGGPNLSATACDATTFSGATTRARTFLIPAAGLPQSFGLTETIATYPAAATAAKAAAKIQSEMATCHKRQIGTSVTQHQALGQNALAPAVAIWHEQAEINSKSQIAYWMGLVRRGRVVVQITFIPAPKVDTTAAAFLALVERGAQRLSQLP